MKFLFSGRGSFKGFKGRCMVLLLLNKRLVATRPISKVLVANRGEIACRVMRTARSMGVQTVAVYSDADRQSMHVQMADEAYCIGPPPSQESYLQQERLLTVALRSGCQALHPGYGFLSENAEFAQLCEDRGVIFIGPPASAIRDMGIKSTAKRIMSEAGVPVIPGYHGEDQSNERLLHEAALIGFPLMIKAVKGGGGKGMRVARGADDFLQQLSSARSEAEKAFGDGSVLLEALVEQPRHVEVQVFADALGGAVHLFERDCSLQRRHQKVLEEAPAPGLSAEERAALGAAAVRAAKAVGYVGAGTVEFILDRRSHAFHFMEMNTRLQVEHPVTEMVTGTDLVQWQLLVASGEPLPRSQEQLSLRGHSLEARIYAEAPRRGFLPAAGPLRFLRPPRPRAPLAHGARNHDTRVETGVQQGDEVSVHYDPMIAKLVVWGADRPSAIAKMSSRLAEYKIAGVDTNVEFLRALCQHPSFVSGDVHTGFIQQHQQQLLAPKELPQQVLVQAAVGLLLRERLVAERSASTAFNAFSIGFGFRVNEELIRRVAFTHQGKELEVEVVYRGGGGKFLVRCGGNDLEVEASLQEADDGGLELSASVGGAHTSASLSLDGGSLDIFTQGDHWQMEVPPPKYLQQLEKAACGEADYAGGASPMPGVVDRVLVAEGQRVHHGEPIAVVIAMKMEYVVKAPREGEVLKVLVSAGQNVTKGTVLVTLKEEPLLQQHDTNSS